MFFLFFPVTAELHLTEEEGRTLIRLTFTHFPWMRSNYERRIRRLRLHFFVNLWNDDDFMWMKKGILCGWFVCTRIGYDFLGLAREQ